jgi:hypothetical protein
MCPNFPITQEKHLRSPRANLLIAGGNFPPRPYSLHGLCRTGPTTGKFQGVLQDCSDDHHPLRMSSQVHAEPGKHHRSSRAIILHRPDAAGLTAHVLLGACCPRRSFYSPLRSGSRVRIRDPGGKFYGATLE